MRSLGLYIHWPFCLSKCPYCDFNSFVSNTIDIEEYTQAYMHELERFYAETSAHILQTIFFGGGTPSLMPPSLTAQLIEKAQTLWCHNDSLEITLEANPSTAETSRFQAFKDAGINRLSIGIQSFSDNDLHFLGRGHSANEGMKAIDMAQKIFNRVSFDLIYARPSQTLSDWEKELRQGLAFGTTHLSLYQLTIEPGTAFAPRYDRGEIILPEDDLAADMYNLTQAITAEKGLPMYEISNHAMPGFESQHNLIYWRYEDYVGVGPGAHGRYYNHRWEKIAAEQHKAPNVWCKKVLNDGSGTIRSTVITENEQLCERLMMGLRLKEGLSLPDVSFVNEKALHTLITSGDLVMEGEHMRLTSQGFPRLNGILRYLLRR